MQIAERLKTHGLSIRELARMADVSHTALRFIVDGKTQNPGCKTLAKIEKALAQLEVERPAEPTEQPSQ
jgi:transcriptional regulator with XRE-family HTH domain